MDQVKIFDTTLRDGEQSPGISLDVTEKLEIADQLARLGVDIIEAGFPIASDGDFEAVEAIAKNVRGPVIAGLSRTAFKDVDRAWEAVRHAEKARIHVFIATSKIHMEKKLRMTPDQVKAEAAAAVARARSYVDDVEFSPEDGYRSDPDFMCEVCQIAVDNGATTLNIPDTVGFAVPEDFGRLIRYVLDTVKGEFIVSTHCHNDLGLAVANSLAGVEHGARQVECAVNGLGERAGNAALEEIVMAIRTRRDHFGTVDVNVKTEELLRTSRMVSRLTGYQVQFNKAVVGRNAFAHEAGIHQHGVLADRETYEIMDASAVGQEAAQIVMGKHSGRHAFADTLKKMGIHVQGDALNGAFVRFKELADKKIEITEADLEAIVAEELGSGAIHRFTMAELEVSGGTATSPTARVVLANGDGKVEATGTGDGMIDAAIAAIAKATDVEGKVSNFQVSSVTGGSDALGAVAITVEAEGRKVTGRGVATDVVEASARAYLNAVNKIVRLRGEAPREAPVGPEEFGVTTNLWVNEDHALAYLRERDSLPHRVDAYEELLDLVPPSIERVLDLGTGDGVLLDLVLTARPGASGVGLDFGEEMLRRAADRFAGRSVELVRHDLDQPLPGSLGLFDAVVSSFAIHHCSPARVKVLYGEVYDRLRPGGVFVNAEHVDSATPALHEAFLAKLGRTLAEDDPSNQLVGTEQHLNWLMTCGFENVDVFWKWRELAVVAGKKPALV